ncbi:MAG: isopentenyl-diphosphate Delta-isomerase [Bacteroidales bacterium]
MVNENLIAVVDAGDNITGYHDKIEVHRKGLLHRAFSVVVINGKGEWLIQRRAAGKYHSGGVWTNSCCSHLIQGKEMDVAARERLRFEMGVDAEPVYSETFHYIARFDNGLTENEIDHIYVARWDGIPMPDPDEVMEWRWMTPAMIAKELSGNPERWSAWFPRVFDIVAAQVLKNH